MQPALFVGFAVITINRHTITHFVSIIGQSGMRCFVANTIYNIVRVLSLSKSYWARNKIFIYARPCVNKMTWAIFFTWLESFFPVKLQCSFPSLWNMEETSEELPNFSIGIDLLGPDPTSNKNKAEKTRKLHVSQTCRKRKHYFEQSKPLITSGLWLLKHFLVTLEFIWLSFSPFSR